MALFIHLKASYLVVSFHDVSFDIIGLFEINKFKIIPFHLKKKEKSKVGYVKV